MTARSFPLSFLIAAGGLCAALPLHAVEPACASEAAAPLAPIDWAAYGKLTLPVDGDGRKGPDELGPAALRAGTAAPWFRRAAAGETTAGGFHAAGGETVFVAPVDGGATTVNAKYARSELREQIQPGNDRRNWSVAGSHVMTGTVRVSELPVPNDAGGVGKTVIAQIHGVEAAPPVKLQVARKGVDDASILVYGIYNPRPVAGDPERSATALSVLPCAPIRYEIRVADGLLTTTVNGIVLDRRSLLPDWADVPLYFKAGNYVQNKADSASGRAEVIYEEFAIRHR